ncbi:RHS repeat-associated core domain-containing protein [Streptomyces sp. NPDC058442]|uniref:RHS repeat-associated core domain-containing protein n=1 Tax=Streptomyces sp. NPDC058442 TaxID=3346503 RepID=UPI0036463ACA
MVHGLAGGLGAISGKSDTTVLQLSNLHGDISLALPLDASAAPVALSADEYGNRREGREPSRYNWLGSHQRSSETPSGALLMGVRVYNPETGRFLSTDPVYGGSRNAYEYAAANPVTNLDLDGAKVSKRVRYYWWGRAVIEWRPKTYSYYKVFGYTLKETRRSARLTTYFNRTGTRHIASNRTGKAANVLAIVIAGFGRVAAVLAAVVWWQLDRIISTARNARASGRCLGVRTYAYAYKWYTSYGQYPFQRRC